MGDDERNMGSEEINRPFVQQSQSQSVAVDSLESLFIFGGLSFGPFVARMTVSISFSHYSASNAMTDQDHGSRRCR
jgi:hypothetical protein